MSFGILRYRAMQSLVLTVSSSLALVIAFLASSAQSAYAQSPLVFKIPHEVQLAAPLVLDLNGDGKKEMIFASMDGYLTLVDGATYQVVWDKNMADYLPGYNHTRIQSGLAAADLDNDGKIEVVVATGGVDPINSDGPGAIIVLTYVGGSDVFQLKPGWPIFATDSLGPINGYPDGYPDGFYSTPSLGDIDGDGKKEIVIGGMDRRLDAYHYDGTPVKGWPLGRPYGIYRESRSTAALADLDGDGILDVLIGTNSYAIPGCPNPYVFYGIKGGESVTVPLALPGFPFTAVTQNIESSPAIGDINGDGSPDIVFGTGDFDEHCGGKVDGKKVYAIDRTGHLLPGWPVTTNGNTVNSPALGDLDNDGKPEVVIHTQDTLYAWHGDGSLVQGFPVHGEYNLRHASPVLADIDGDSQVEILLASGQVYGPNGQLKEQREKLQGKLVVTDQDGDGLLETIGANHFNYDKGLQLNVYVYQEKGLVTDAQPWPMFHRTNDRNGNLPFLYTLSGRVVDESDNGVPGVTVSLNSGQSAVTDDQGNYIFGSLPSGTYTITPFHIHNPFTPSKLTVTLTDNVTAPKLTMHPPLFDVTGEIFNPNGSPLAGVKVQLDGQATQTTGADGSFNFEDQPLGNHTVRPIFPDFHYLPAERSLNAEDEQPQLFYAIANPVTESIGQNNDTTVSFDDTQGLPTTVTFLDASGPGQATITPLLIGQPNGYLQTGHTMDIEFAGASENTQAVVKGQDEVLISLEIKVKYNKADLQSILKAEKLVLLWKGPHGWEDAQASCPAGNSTDLNLNQKTLTVGVCHYGTYGLFAPVKQIMMPVIGTGAGE